jgi:hypothetical protein
MTAFQGNSLNSCLRLVLSRRLLRPAISTPLRIVGTSASGANQALVREQPIRSPHSKVVRMTRSSSRSEMNESEMATLLLKAQEEERLGQVIRCDSAEEVRDLITDIRSQSV